MRFEFVGLCLVIFLTYCNTTVFYSLYVYLQGLGIGEDWRGFLIGSSSLATIGCFLALSHKLGRQNAPAWAYRGAVLLMACGGCYLVVDSPEAILAVRLANGVGVYLLSASCMTLLVSVIEPEYSGQAFSLYSVAYLLAYSIVPAVFDAATGSQSSIAWGYAIMPLSLLLAVAVIARVKKTGAKAAGPAPAQDKVGYREMLANAAKAEVALMLVINTIYIITFSSLFYMAKGLFVERGYANVGYFFSIQTCSMIGVRLLGNRLYDKVRKVALIRAHFALTVASFVLAATAESLVGLYAAAFLTGVGMGVGSPALYALMFKLSEPKFKSINSNLLMMSLQVGNFLGPLLGAEAVHALGYAGFLWLDAAASVLGLVLCYVITAKRLDPDGLARTS